MIDVNRIGGLKEDEVYKDGMVYCKICGGKRAFEVPEFNIQARVLCKCESDKLKAEEAEKELKERIAKNLKGANITERYKDASFEKLITGKNQMFDDAVIRCKSYTEHLEECLEKGLGIYIYGDKGTGKTHLSICLLKEIINKGYSATITNFFDITNDIKKTFKSNNETESDLIERIANIDFLILDDLGTETLSKNGENTWIQEKVYDVLNKRYNNMKPTIFTSNYSFKELVNDRGMMDKTADRILEMSSVILKIEGTSYRREMRKQEVPF